MSAETHLAKIQVTTLQARDFIFSNIDKPSVLFDAAHKNAVTLDMLSEITDFPTNVISVYFANAKFDAEKLDDVSKLINSDLGALENIVAFNDNTGILSTTSLKEQVLSRLPFDEPVYDAFFMPFSEWEKFFTSDNIYDAEELNVTHLGNVPATKESIESLFYGTLLNIYSTLDQAELSQLNDARDNGILDESQELLVNALTDSPLPIAWTEQALADLVIDEAANIVNDFFIALFDDSNFVGHTGILDRTFAGFVDA